MREAMRGALPEEVRTRPTKTNFVPLALHALLDDLPMIKRVLAAPDAEIKRYADQRIVGSLVDGELTGGMFNGAWIDRVWRLFMAECWLRDQADPEYSKKLLQTGDLPAPNGSRPTFLHLVAQEGQT